MTGRYGSGRYRPESAYLCFGVTWGVSWAATSTRGARHSYLVARIAPCDCGRFPAGTRPTRSRDTLPLSLHVGSWRVPGVSCRPVRTGRCGCGMLPPARTVSYTHLRAHETRHDIVCRLL